LRINGQLETGQASPGGHVLAGVEEGGAVGMELSDVTLWEWLGMTKEKEYRCS